jgi:hypothetical protein
MSNSSRKLLGIAGIGLSWGVVWGAVFALLDLVAGVLRPGDVGPGEGPVTAAAIGSGVGLVFGAAYGIILAVAERRKAILDLSLARVAIWGLLAAAVWPLATAVHDSMVIILCPLGASCAAAAVAIARRAGARRWIDRLVAGPLRAVCA